MLNLLLLLFTLLFILINLDLVGALNVLKRAGHAQIACGDIDLIRGLAQEPAQITAFG